jgi:hypothetical protein
MKSRTKALTKARLSPCLLCMALGIKKEINMQKHKGSCISGDFEGWHGDKAYELDDGSKWELVSYTYAYSYSYRPRAIIWRDGGRHYLEVQNMNDKQEVREVW